MVDRSISAAISQQTRQSHSVGIIVLQPLLTPQRVADGSLQSCRQFDYLFARISAPIAAKNSDGASVVNHVDEQAQVRIRRAEHRCPRDIDIDRLTHGRRLGDIPGNREYGRTLLNDRSAYGSADYGLSLSGID